MELEDYKRSVRGVGQLLPVLENAKGEIIDGYHRKRIDPNWRVDVLPIEGELETLKVRVHLNVMRRDVPSAEMGEWIEKCRAILKKEGKKGTQQEIAEALEMSRQWVTKHDPVKHQEHPKVPQRGTFYGYNVWGFKDESWRELIVGADPSQPDVEFYHGSTPAFVIHQLIRMFKPKSVLDSMAGMGTTGYVCQQHGIPCDQFDIYPYPKYGVLESDAESVNTGETYDLIFNHIPYLKMVKYGDSKGDLSTMKKPDFFAKLGRIFNHNRELLNPGGVYAVLVGEWRSGRQLIPITSRTKMLGLEKGFVLWDEAIKLTTGMKGKPLQEHRAAKHGYLAQTYDTVLIFKKAKE